MSLKKQLKEEKKVCYNTYEIIPTLYTYTTYIFQIILFPHTSIDHIQFHPRSILPSHIHPWYSNDKRLKNPSRPPILLTLRYQFYELSTLSPEG